MDSNLQTITQDRPILSDDPLYRLIRDRKIEAFNQQRGDTCDFSWLDFRGLDLRGIDTRNIDFSNAYFRNADLRGLDLRTCNLEGANIHGAQIAGAYFPINLSADELLLSCTHGARMRYTR